MTDKGPHAENDKLRARLIQRFPWAFDRMARQGGLDASGLGRG